MEERKFRCTVELKDEYSTWTGEKEKIVIKVGEVFIIDFYDRDLFSLKLNEIESIFIDAKQLFNHFQEITEAEETSKHIIKHIISDYEFKLLNMTNKWEQGMKCCNSDYLMEDMNDGTICLSKEQYDYLKQLLGE